MIYIASFTRYTEIKNSYVIQNYKNKNDLILDFIKSLCETQNYCPELTQLILICHSFYKISRNDFVEYVHGNKRDKIKYLSVPTLLEDNLPKLLLDTQIFTEKDLPALYSRNLPPKEKGLSLNLDTTKLFGFIGDKKVVINSKFLCDWFINVIEKIPDVEIYRRSFERTGVSRLGLVRVAEKEKEDYLTMMRGSLDSSPTEIKIDWGIHSIIDCFKYAGKTPQSINKFYKEGSKVFKGSIRKINLLGFREHQYLIENFIADIEKEYGYDRIDGSLTIDNYKNSIVVIIENQLGPSQLKYIKTAIHTDKSHDKFYILLSSEPLQYLRDPSIHVIMLPTFDHIRPVLDRLTVYMSKKILDSQEAKFLAEMLNNKSIKNIFSWVHSIDDLGKALHELKSFNHFTDIDFRHRDFWWSFLCYMKKEYLAKEKKIKRHTHLMISANGGPAIFKFTHKGNAEYWTVENPKSKTSPLAPLPYGEYKGLYYMLILAKCYYEEQYEIGTKQLADEVIELKIGETKGGNKNPYKSIPEAISSFCCEQRDEFKFLFKNENSEPQKFFKIGKTNSRFNPQGKIEIIVEDDEIDKVCNKIIADLK